MKHESTATGARRSWVMGVLAACCLGALVPTTVARAELDAPAPADRAADEAPSASRAAGLVARRPAAPAVIAPPLGLRDLSFALEASRPEGEACLRAAGARRASVRVSLDPASPRSPSSRLSIRVGGSPALRGCLETAVRRHVLPLAMRPLARRVSATLSLSVGPSVPPPPVPPPPVTPPPDGHEPPRNDRYSDASVVRALQASHSSLLACAPGAHGSAGSISLRVVVRTDGGMRLEGASAPPGVLQPGGLPCLSQVVGALRVPAPASDRTVLHEVPYS